MKQTEFIKPDAVIDIKISTPFYKRIQDLAIYFTRLVSPEELNNQIVRIKNDQELSEFGEHFKTLLILASEIEHQAKEQGHTELIEQPEA